MSPIYLTTVVPFDPGELGYTTRDIGYADWTSSKIQTILWSNDQGAGSVRVWSSCNNTQQENENNARPKKV